MNADKIEKSLNVVNDGIEVVSTGVICTRSDIDASVCCWVSFFPFRG